MFKSMQQLFIDDTRENILAAIKITLDNTDESPFWGEKVLPLASAILSVLVPLRDQSLLFDPEGKPSEQLTPELFLRWCDLLSLKTLAFTLQRSNKEERLERTGYDAKSASDYKKIDLEHLGTYLSSYTVNLDNEFEDFPIAHYNLHIGITDVMKKLI